MKAKLYDQNLLNSIFMKYLPLQDAKQAGCVEELRNGITQLFEEAEQALLPVALTAQEIEMQTIQFIYEVVSFSRTLWPENHERIPFGIYVKEGSQAVFGFVKTAVLQDKFSRVPFVLGTKTAKSVLRLQAAFHDRSLRVNFEDFAVLDDRARASEKHELQ